MILEFLSSGRLVPLPETMELSGLPSGAGEILVVLLPYGRALVGDLFCGYERWRFGKLGRFPWREISLYDESPQKLSAEGLGAILLPGGAVTRLRGLLLTVVPPPGSHRETLKVLMPLLTVEARALPGLARALPVEDLLAGDGALQRGYWGVRLGLFRRDEEAVERQTLWLRRARHSFGDVQGVPLLWTSPSDVPAAPAREMLLSLGFGREQVSDFRSPDNPSIHRSQWGILLKQRLFSASEEGIEMRLWAFFPVPLWENLRRRDGLTLVESLWAARGYLEAQEAEAFFRPYRSPWQGRGLAAAIGPDRHETL